MTRRNLSLFRRVRRNEDGSIAMEGAIVMSVLAIVLLVMVDIGFYISTKVELKQALRAGAQQALTDTSLTAVTAAVEAATYLDVTVESVSGTESVLTCYCDDGTTETDCTSQSECTSNEWPQGFAEFRASTTFEPMFLNVGFFTESFTVSETAYLRVQ